MGVCSKMRGRRQDSTGHYAATLVDRDGARVSVWMTDANRTDRFVVPLVGRRGIEQVVFIKTTERDEMGFRVFRESTG